MRPAKIVAIIIGALLIIIGLAVLAPGSLLLWINGTQKDSNGFFSTSFRDLNSSGYALITPEVQLHLGSGNWIPGGGTVQIRATGGGAAPIFVGVGPTDQVTAYLSGVAYDEVTNLGWFSASVQYSHHEGSAPSAPPEQQTFWTAKQEGTGTQTLQWQVQSGNWTAVLMNGDATAPVNVSVSLGARLGFLLPLGIGLTAAGVVILAVGILLVILGARRSRLPMQPGYPGGPSGPYPQPPYQHPNYPQPPYGPHAPPYQGPPYQGPPYQQPPPPYQGQPPQQPPQQSPPQQQPPPVPPPSEPLPSTPPSD